MNKRNDGQAYRGIKYDVELFDDVDKDFVSPLPDDRRARGLAVGLIWQGRQRVVHLAQQVWLGGLSATRRRDRVKY